MFHGILEAGRKRQYRSANRRPVRITKLNAFIKEFWTFYTVRIAEANMIGIAAGLTIGGKIPYTTTFANFLRAVFMIKFANLLRIVIKM